MSAAALPDPLLIYDGECRFCHSTVSFVQKREKRAELSFAWNQSPEIRQFLAARKEEVDAASVLLWKDDTLYKDSTAALLVCPYLKAPWSWGRILLHCPRPIRDKVYGWVANSRKKIMGSMTCTLPMEMENRYYGS